MTEAVFTSWLQAGESIAAAATRFAHLGANSVFEAGATEANVDRPLRDAGTFSNLLVRVSAITMTDSSTFDLRDDGVSTALTVTIGTTAGDYEDTANTAAPAAASLINWRVVAGTTGTSFTITMVSVEFDSTSNCVTILATDAAGSSNLSVASTTNFFGALGDRTTSTTEDTWDFRVRAGCTWSDLRFQVGTCTRTTDVTVVSRVEAANGNQSITATGGDDNVAYEDTANSDTLVVDNDIDISFTTGTGTGNWNLEKIGSTLITTTREFFLCVHGNPERFNAGLTRFWPIGGGMTGGEEATEANVTLPAPFACTLSDLTAKCTAATGVIDSTIRARVSGANGNQVINFVDGATGVVTDASNTDAVAFDANINTSLVTVNGTNVDFSYVAMMGVTAAAGGNPKGIFGLPLDGPLRRVVYP